MSAMKVTKVKRNVPTSTIGSPTQGERLGDVVDRLHLSIEAAIARDSGKPDLCTVNTYDLMIVVGLMKKLGPKALNEMVGVTRRPR